jgi:hypothetical protein
MENQIITHATRSVYRRLDGLGEHRRDVARYVGELRQQAIEALFAGHADIEAAVFAIYDPATPKKIGNNGAAIVAAGVRRDKHPAIRDANRIGQMLVEAADALWPRERPEQTILARRIQGGVEITEYELSEVTPERVLAAITAGEPLHGGRRPEHDGTPTTLRPIVVISVTDVEKLAEGDIVNTCGPDDEPIDLNGATFEERSIAALRAGEGCAEDGYFVTAQPPQQNA